MQQTILYNGSEVVVSKEVAEFLEQERRREQAEERSDRRHKDFTDLEAAETLIRYDVFTDPVLNEIIHTDNLERLRNIVNTLDDDSRQLIELYYFKECSLTATAEFFGITKQALLHWKNPEHLKVLCKFTKTNTW